MKRQSHGKTHKHHSSTLRLGLLWMHLVLSFGNFSFCISMQM